MRDVSAWLALGLVVGAAAGVWFDLGPRPWLAVLATSWMTVVVAFVRRRPRVLLVGAVSGSVAVGAALGDREAVAALDPPILRQTQADVPGGCGTTCPGRPVQFEGLVRADAELTEFGASFTLDATQVWLPGAGPTATSGGVRLSVGGALVAAVREQWTAGRRLRVTATLRRPQAYRNFGAFDQESRTALAGVRLAGSVKSAALVGVVSRGTRLDEAGATVRRRVRAIVHEVVGRRDPGAAAVVVAVLIGDRAGLSPDVEARLQRAGTFHVIAISGGNIALLVALLLWASRRAGQSPRAQALTALVVVALYAAVVAGGSSVARATLGASLYLAARALDHRASARTVIGVAAATLLVARPLTVLDVGFWLTFVASLAILEQAAWVSKRIEGWCRAPAPGAAAAVWRMGSLLLAATLVAEAALAPLTALIFGQVTSAGLLLNFLAVPLMSVVQMAGLVVVALGSLHTALAAPAGLVATLAARGITDSARAVELAPWAAPHVAPPALWLVMLVMMAWWCAWAQPGYAARRVSAALWALGLVVIITGWPSTFDGLSRNAPLRRPSCREPELPDRRSQDRAWLRVTFLDVAQGDATLMRLPDGTTMLVDAGGAAAGSPFDVGARVVAPALWALGVRRLMAVVATHGDADHIGGAPAILERFQPKEVWEGVPVPAHQPLRVLAGRAATAGAAWRRVHGGEVWRAGAARLRVWHPPAPDWQRRRIRNDDSVVIEARLGGASIVLPGDVSAGVEAQLAARFAPSPLRVLKSAHHGSAQGTSAIFLDALTPKAVVVSAGRDNRYGHPAPAVLARLDDRGIEVFRTDRDGAIALDTDGVTLRLSTCSGRVRTVAVASR